LCCIARRNQGDGHAFIVASGCLVVRNGFSCVALLSPCCARPRGTVAVVVLAMLTSQTGICPITPQSQHIGVCGILVVPCCFQWRCCCIRHCTLATWSWIDRLMLRWRLCWCCAGVLAHIALAVSPALRCCLYRCIAGVIVLLHGHLCPCCAGLVTLVAPTFAISIANWCLPRHNAIMTRWHTWHRHCAPSHCLWFLLP
jgi:hypothetical protein